MRQRSPANGHAAERRIRIVHLFPDLLSVYGDSGNISTLRVRAERRGIKVTLERVLADSEVVPAADLLVAGGGQDRDQLAVEVALGRLCDSLTAQVQGGAALLAVCGGYQSLGHSYRTGDDRVVLGPGIFNVATDAGPTRMVGPVVAELVDDLFGDGPRTIVGFENHSGRTHLCDWAQPLATVEIGWGNNGTDGTEGTVAVGDRDSLRGLRIGTYLHGPLLPRNPHVADALLRAALARTGQPTDLEPLDDTDEWRAHDRFVTRSRHRSLSERLPRRLRQIIDPARSLIGF